MPASKPEELDQVFEEAIGRGEVDAILALYEPGAVLRTEQGDAIGPDAIRQVIGGFAAMKAQLKMNVVSTAVIGDIAVLFNDWTGSGTGADGQPVPLAGKAVEVARRQGDGSWLYIFDAPFARS